MHTKGPWHLNTLNDLLPVMRTIKSGHGEADKYYAVVVANDEPAFELVCRLGFGYGKPNDEANARLIAAAPKLLEALEANHTLILKLIHDQAVREDYIAEFMGPVIRNNNLIISKAKGE